MIVVAIVGILASLTVTSYERYSAFGAVQAAANDLQSALGTARTRASARNVDVWVIIYPGVVNAGGLSSGAFVMLEDPTGNYQTSFGTFQAANAVTPPASGRVLSTTYLASYAKAAPQFSVPPGGTFVAPFSALNEASVARACSFCSGSGDSARGAIVFQPSGSARFVKGDGTDAPSGLAALALTGAGGDRGYLYAVSSAVGFTRNWAVP